MASHVKRLDDVKVRGGGKLKRDGCEKTYQSNYRQGRLTGCLVNGSA